MGPSELYATISALAAITLADRRNTLRSYLSAPFVERAALAIVAAILAMPSQRFDPKLV